MSTQIKMSKARARFTRWFSESLSHRDEPDSAPNTPRDTNESKKRAESVESNNNSHSITRRQSSNQPINNRRSSKDPKSSMLQDENKQLARLQRRMSKHLSMESGSWSQHFSSKQLRAIQMAWMRLTKEQTNSKPNSIRLTERIFDNFKKRQPITGSIFAKAACVEGMLMRFDTNRSQRKVVSFREHGRACCDLLENIVLSIYANSPLPDDYDLDTIGRRHGCLSSVGFTAEMWEQWGECMVEVLISSDGLQSHPDGKRAWMQLVAFMVDRMRNGFEREVQRQKRLMQRQDSITASQGGIQSTTTVPQQNDVDSPNVSQCPVNHQFTHNFSQRSLQLPVNTTSSTSNSSDPTPSPGYGSMNSGPSFQLVKQHAMDLTRVQSAPSSRILRSASVRDPHDELHEFKGPMTIMAQFGQGLCSPRTYREPLRSPRGTRRMNTVDCMVGN